MPLRNLKGIIEYDGTDFNGFQIQPEGSRTVQGEVTEALSKVLDHPLKIIGASRTDSGVHALGQVISFNTSGTRTVNEIKNGANSKSPGDWRFVELTEVSMNFHARFDAVSKTYIYLIDRLDSVLRRRMSWGIAEKIDIESMRKASELFKGEHDFKSFTTSGAHANDNTIRRIDEVDCIDETDLIMISIKGGGFLYQMARRIVSGLVKIAKGELKVDDIDELLQNPRFDAIGFAAPAKGLILKEVNY